MKELKLPDIETVDNLSEPETEDDGDGTSIEAKNEMEDIERQQEINEAVANVPTEFDINGKTVRIHSKSARDMVRIDKAIMNLLKVQYKRETVDIESGETFWEEMDSLQESYYETTFEVLYLIINSNTESPEFDKEWIKSFRNNEDIYRRFQN